MRGWSVRYLGGLLLIGFLGTTARGQAVQLPTFEFFSVQTSVLVPDRGAAYLGGVTRSRYGSVSRGVPGLSKLPGAGRLFRNRGIASSHSTSGVRVSATIIDHAEWDRAVLAEGERLAGARVGRGGFAADPKIARRAAFLAGHVATHEEAHEEVSRAEPSARIARQDIARQDSVEEIRRRNEAARHQRQADARRYWERGRAAEQAGKFGAARIYYQMAARHAESPARERILAYVQQQERDQQQRAQHQALSSPEPTTVGERSGVKSPLQR